MRLANRIAVLTLSAAVVAAVPGVAVADEEIRDRQWHLERLDLAGAHQQSRGGGIVIGLVDTGVDAAHPDLKGAVSDGEAFGESVDPMQDPEDHGTGVASVLVGRGHGDDNAEGVLGVAPDAKIISASIGAPEGDAAARTKQISEAIEYLTDAEVDIILVTVTSGEADPAGQDVVNRAVEGKSIPIVTPVGDADDPESAFLQHPAGYTKTISVVGTGMEDELWQGSTPPNQNKPEEVGAPGVEIPVAASGGDYDVRNGTAYAAAITAGTAALVMARWPGLSVEELTNQIVGVGTTPVSDVEALGVVSPQKALNSDIEGHDPVDIADHPNATGSAEGDVAYGNPMFAAAVGVVGALALAGLVVGTRLYDRRKIAAMAVPASAPPVSAPPNPRHTPPGGIPRP
ncbi:MAG: S8 family peptidase [Stackebrandtia sp.]